MTEEQAARIYETRLDVDMWPSSKPRRRPIKMKNRSHKRKLYSRKPTEARALRYTSTSEGW